MKKKILGFAFVCSMILPNTVFAQQLMMKGGNGKERGVNVDDAEIVKSVDTAIVVEKRLREGLISGGIVLPLKRSNNSSISIQNKVDTSVNKSLRINHEKSSSAD